MRNSFRKFIIPPWRRKTAMPRLVSGQAALIAVLFVITVSIAMVAGFAFMAFREARVLRTNYDANRSYYLAEAAIEDAIYRIQENRAIGVSETIAIDGYSASVTVSSPSDDEYTLASEGNLSQAIRRISVRLEKGVGASFAYGAQVGYLGLNLENSAARITGRVYSNGPVTATNYPRITGDAYVASKPSLDESQPNQSSTFAYRNAASRQDFAQSFIPKLTAYPEAVKIWMRKVGSPSGSISAYLRQDDGAAKPEVGGLPFGSGQFQPQDVGASIGPVTVSMSNQNPLIEGTKYWIILDAESWNAANHYEIATDLDASYATGTALYGTDWQSGAWTPLGQDARFEVHLETDQNPIEEIIVGTAGTGNVYAYEIKNGTRICGSAFYQAAIDGDSLAFLNGPNTQNCGGTAGELTPGTAFAGVTAPLPRDLPLNLAEIQRLVDRADRGGTLSGDLILLNNQTATLGPTKITGNVSLDSHSVLTMTGDLHVAGTFVCNQGEVRLDAGYGDGSGVIIVDGTSQVTNNCDLKGSGHQDSYLMLLSRQPARDSSPPAIHLKNLSNAIDKAIIYAHFGEVMLENNLSVHQVTGAQVKLKNQAEVVYESGLADVTFTSGPTGGWDIQRWEEVE